MPKQTDEEKLAAALAELVAWYGSETVKNYHARLFRAEKLLKRLAPAVLAEQEAAAKKYSEGDD